MCLTSIGRRHAAGTEEQAETGLARRWKGIKRRDTDKHRERLRAETRRVNTINRGKEWLIYRLTFPLSNFSGFFVGEDG